MQIASNADKVISDFNRAFQNIKTATNKKNVRYAPEVGKRELEGIQITYIRQKTHTEEIWEMKGLDDIVQKYVDQFFVEYAPEGYSSFVLKIAENKYYFYNSNSCD
jgi:hypothetical protein